MVCEICREEAFLAQKAEAATAEDLGVAQDLLDTLAAHRDGCVGMAANMIGVNKRIIAFESDGKYMVDLRRANARRLVQLGIRPENIDVSEECTYCSHDKYWSHRYSKGHRGSQGAVIVIE